VLLLLPVALARPVTTPPESEAREEEEANLPADRFETKRGTVAIETDPGEDFTFWATLDGERLVKLEGDRVTIAGRLGQEARDVFLLEVASGGIACPMKYRLVDLRSRQKPVVSEELGSCAEWEDFAFEGSKVVIRMPAYVPHPDLLTEKEVRRLEKTTYLYSWASGKVGERTVVGK
jgi:hypothetical protein